MNKIVAHRGSSGTHPENTLAAFKEAARVGAEILEIDVHFTKDKELVVIHDPTVDRTTNGTGLVNEKTLKEIKKLYTKKSGFLNLKKERIPSLKEVLEWVKQTNLTLNIELKYTDVFYEDFEADVLNLLSECEFNQPLIISSFNHEALHKVHQLNPNIELAILYRDPLYDPISYIKRFGVTSLHPSKKVISDSLIEACAAEGIPVRIYTLNSKREIKKYLKYPNVAIVTDYPEKALKIRQLNS